MSATGDTNAPSLSNFNLASYTLMPDVPEIWVQGQVNDEAAVVEAHLGASNTVPLNVIGNRCGAVVPLAFGTNNLVLSARDLAGNSNTYAFVVERTDRYRAAITSPAFGAFANNTQQVVNGYVSQKLDEGQSNEDGRSGPPNSSSRGRAASRVAPLRAGWAHPSSGLKR